MMATTHAIVGGLIASKFASSPLLAGGLIVGSHLFMDLIPHWDFGTDWEKRSKAATGLLAIADTLIAFVVSFLLFSSLLPWWWIIIAVSLANLPDWMEAPWFMFFAKQGEQAAKSGNIVRKFFYWVYKVQELYLHTMGRWPHGVYTQLGTLAFFWLLLR